MPDVQARSLGREDSQMRLLPQLELPFRPYVPFSDPGTSREAAQELYPHVARLEALVLESIRQAGAFGMCDHEIEARTGLIHQTASARRRGLVLKGLVKDSGERRTTPSGRKARVWVASQ